MRKSIMLLSAAALFMCSCSLPHQGALKRQPMYHSVANGDGTQTIQEGEFGKYKEVTISDKGDYLIITPVGTPTVVRNAATNVSPPSGWKLDNVSKWYFPEEEHAPLETTFWYHDERLVLQTLAIPIKIRPKLSGQLRDSFPSVTETGLTLGFAGGYKFSWNRFSTSKNLWGNNTNKYSFTPGIFIGTGATDLKKSNTRDPVIEFERKTATISPGVFLVLGFNNINFGYALGFDFATGPGSKEWLYQGKPWHGIIVALDIIK